MLNPVHIQGDLVTGDSPVPGLPDFTSSSIDAYDPNLDIFPLLDDMSGTELKAYMDEQSIEYKATWNKAKLLKAAKGK